MHVEVATGRERRRHRETDICCAQRTISSRTGPVSWGSTTGAPAKVGESPRVSPERVGWPKSQPYDAWIMQAPTAHAPARHWLLSFALSEEGAGLVEYALIIAVVAVGVIIAMIFLREQMSNIFSSIGNNVQNPCLSVNQQGQCP